MSLSELELCLLCTSRKGRGGFRSGHPCAVCSAAGSHSFFRMVEITKVPVIHSSANWIHANPSSSLVQDSRLDSELGHVSCSFHWYTRISPVRERRVHIWRGNPLQLNPSTFMYQKPCWINTRGVFLLGVYTAEIKSVFSSFSCTAAPFLTCSRPLKVSNANTCYCI